MVSALRVGKRAWIEFSIKLAISLAILAGCVSLVDLEAVRTAVTRIEWFTLVVAFALATVATIVLPAMATRHAMQIDRVRFSLAELVWLNFATRFYVLVLPRAAALALRWFRYREKGTGQDAAALILFERLVQLFAMLLVATIALSLELPKLGDLAYLLFSISAAGCLVLVVSIVPFIVKRTAPLFEWGTRRAEGLLPQFAVRPFIRILEAVSAFHSLPKSSAIYMLIISLASYVLFILSPYLVGHALDLDISLMALAWIRPLVFIFTLLPFSIGGVGIREVGFIALLGQYGISSPEALVFSLVLFSLQIGIGAIGAGAELARLIRPSSSPERSA